MCVALHLATLTSALLRGYLIVKGKCPFLYSYSDTRLQRYCIVSRILAGGVYYLSKRKSEPQCCAKKRVDSKDQLNVCCEHGTKSSL